MPRFACGLLCVAVLALLAGCGEEADPVLAEVGDQQIPLSEFQRAFDEILRGDAGYRPDSSSARRFLQTYIDKTLLEQIATDSIPWTPLLEHRATAILENNMVRELRRRVIHEPATPSEEQLREVYAKADTRYHYRAILFPAEAEARATLRTIREGAAFEKVAEHMMDQAGGSDMGWQTILSVPEAFVDALAELGPGEVSEPVFADGRFYLLQLVERAPNSDLEPFAELRPELERKTLIERGGKLQHDFQQELLDKYQYKPQMANVIWLTHLFKEKTAHIPRRYRPARNPDGSVSAEPRGDAIPWETCPIPEEDQARTIATSLVDTVSAVLVLDHLMEKLQHTWPTFDSPSDVLHLTRELMLDRLERAEAWARGLNQDPDLFWEARKRRNLILTRQFYLRKIRSRARPSVEEARRYFENHPAEFRQPAQRRCIQVLLPTWDEALAAQGILQSTPAPAVALSAVRARFPGARIGTPEGVLLQAGNFRNQVERQVFEMQAGEVTDPYPLEGGFIVVRVEEAVDGQLPSFESVAEDIMDQLGSETADSLFKDVLRRRKEATPITIDEDVFRQVRFSPAGGEQT